MDPWACHWPKEDPWRYYYNSFRLNEPVKIAVKWLVALKEARPQGATITVVASNKLVQDKGKRNIVGAQRLIKATS